ncbi:MAG: hypothetical protein WCR49_13480 [Opitutae bacterium]
MEIDENFGDLHGRTGGLETEVQAARGAEVSVGARLGVIEGDIEGLDPEFQNNLIASVLGAFDMAALANRELDRFRRVRIQEGETTIYNRGIISGFAITRQTASVRILDQASGSLFIHGRGYSDPSEVSATTVPGNSSGSVATCSVYLYIDGDGLVQCECTPLNTAAPSTGIVIYTVSVPAGSTADNGAFTLTDVRRIETGYPNVFVAPVYASIALPYILPDATYAVHLEIVSCEGGMQQVGALEVADRLTNGFKIYLGGAADAVCIRYTVRRMI